MGSLVPGYFIVGVCFVLAIALPILLFWVLNNNFGLAFTPRFGKAITIVCQLFAFLVFFGFYIHFSIPGTVGRMPDSDRWIQIAVSGSAGLAYLFLFNRMRMGRRDKPLALQAIALSLLQIFAIALSVAVVLGVQVIGFLIWSKLK